MKKEQCLTSPTMERMKVLELLVLVVTLLSAVPLAAANLRARTRRAQDNKEEAFYFNFSNIQTDAAVGCPRDIIITREQDSRAFRIDFGTDFHASTNGDFVWDAKHCVLSADVNSRNNMQFRVIEAQYGGRVNVPDDAGSFARAEYRHFLAGIDGGLVKWEFVRNTTKPYKREQEVGPISWSTCGGTDEFRVHITNIARKKNAFMRDVQVYLNYAAVNPGLGNCRYEVEVRNCDYPPQNCLGNTLSADDELGIDSAICSGNYRFGLNSAGDFGLWGNQELTWPQSREAPQGKRLMLQKADARIVLFGDDGQGIVFGTTCRDNGSQANKCEEMYINMEGDVKIQLEGGITGWKLNNQGKETCLLN